MPVTLSIDHDRREATTVATGRITMDDIRKHVAPPSFGAPQPTGAHPRGDRRRRAWQTER